MIHNDEAAPVDPVACLNRLMRAAPAGAPRWHRYFEPVPELSVDLPVPIVGVMVLIWQLREQDLQPLFPLDSKQSRLDFITWCLFSGRREYRALRDAAPFWDALRGPAHFEGADLEADDAAHALSWELALAARGRGDLPRELHTAEGRDALLLWYLIHGRDELAHDDAAPLAPWQIEHLLAPSPLPGLNRAQHLLYRNRADVRTAFPLPGATAGYLGWYARFAAQTGLADALRARAAAPRPAPAAAPFGVNVIGYAYGQIGIGEDARMAARSLLTTDVPMTMLDFPPGDDIPQNERGMERHVGPAPLYAVNMFCLTALEHGRCFAVHGAGLLAGRRNIGYWPWELPAWPEPWRHLLALADEVWLSSRYTYDALAPVGGVPLRLMPMAVEAAPVSRRSRADFGLPAAAKLFLFAFDLNSSAKRKNPEACVRAFLEAFPASGPDAETVGLVIKVHPPKTPHSAWTGLKLLQQRDARIHLIEQTLDRADLLALYRACDCFISLHRAEGFGRNIAEAMLLGRPVIATDFSGNLSFNDWNNALLVGHEPLALADGDYPYGAGQYWADADVSIAAMQMRRVLRQHESVAGIAARGQATIAARHAPAVVGAAYARALRASDV